MDGAADYHVSARATLTLSAFDPESNLEALHTQLLTANPMWVTLGDKAQRKTLC